MSGSPSVIQKTSAPQSAQLLKRPAAPWPDTSRKPLKHRWSGTMKEKILKLLKALWEWVLDLLYPNLDDDQYSDMDKYF